MNDTNSTNVMQEIGNLKINNAILEVELNKVHSRIDKSVILFQKLYKEVQELKSENESLKALLRGEVNEIE